MKAKIILFFIFLLLSFTAFGNPKRCTEHADCSSQGLACLVDDSTVAESSDEATILESIKRDDESSKSSKLKDIGAACVVNTECSSDFCQNKSCSERKICREGDLEEFVPRGTACAEGLLRSPQDGTCMLSPEAENDVFAGLMDEAKIENNGKCQFSMDEDQQQAAAAAIITVRSLEWLLSNDSNAPGDCLGIHSYLKKQIGTELTKGRREIVRLYNESYEQLIRETEIVIKALESSDQIYTIHGKQIAEKDLFQRKASGYDALMFQARMIAIQKSFESSMKLLLQNAQVKLIKLYEDMKKLKDKNKFSDISKLETLKDVPKHCRPTFFTKDRKVKNRWSNAFLVKSTADSNKSLFLDNELIGRYISLISGSSEEDVIKMFTSKQKPKKFLFIKLNTGFPYLLDPLYTVNGKSVGRNQKYIDGSGNWNLSALKKTFEDSIFKWYQQQHQTSSSVIDPELLNLNAKICFENTESDCPEFHKMVQDIADIALAQFISFSFNTKRDYKLFHVNANSLRRKLVARGNVELSNLNRYYEATAKHRDDQINCVGKVVNKIVTDNKTAGQNGITPRGTTKGSDQGLVIIDESFSEDFGFTKETEGVIPPLSEEDSVRISDFYKTMRKNNETLTAKVPGIVEAHEEIYKNFVNSTKNRHPSLLRSGIRGDSFNDRITNSNSTTRADFHSEAGPVEGAASSAIAANRKIAEADGTKSNDDRSDSTSRSSSRNKKVNVNRPISDEAIAAYKYLFPEKFGLDGIVNPPGKDPGKPNVPSVPDAPPKDPNQGIPLSEIVGSPGADVEIRPGEKVYIDKSIEVGKLTINGSLSCKSNTSQEIEVKAKTINVNGLFTCGTPSSPVQNKFTISLKHSDADPKSLKAEYRGLVVNRGGRMVLNGAKLSRNFVRLNETIFPGATNITLDASVSDWKVGDKVVIAPTSYNPEEAESFQVKSVKGNVISLSAPVKFKHWGKIQKIKANYGEVVLDQRAEVANLTRNIVIRPDESTSPVTEGDGPKDQLGGHVMVHKGGFAQIDSVEFFRMGQAGIMARYPFHWHLLGDEGSGQYIKNSSVHESFQRCITVHGTNNTLVENNVCYNFKGHGYFLEDGNEINNVLKGNIGIFAKYPSDSKLLLASDNKNKTASGVVLDRFPAVSVFWISNPQNTVINNIAAGSVGTGIWNAFEISVAQGSMNPHKMKTTEFSNNVAHSCIVGFNWDGAPGSTDMGNKNNTNDRKIGPVLYEPSNVPIFRNLVAYKNFETGVYFRGKTALFEGAVFADNGQSFFFAYNQLVKNSTVVGKSENNGKEEEKYITGKRVNGKGWQAGILMYDGPFELENVHFESFSTTDKQIVPIRTVSGADEYFNRIKKASFHPEPFVRALTTSTSAGLEKLRDLDGSLTGIPGSMLVAKGSVSFIEECKDDKRFEGFKVCPPDFSDIVLSVYGAWIYSNDIPYKILRNDGLFRTTKTQNVSILNSQNVQYDIVVQKNDDNYPLYLKLHSENGNTITPVLRIRGAGSKCSLINAQHAETVIEVKSLRDLQRQFFSTAYYSSDNDLYVKIKSYDFFTQFLTRSELAETDMHFSSVYQVKCAEKMKPEIVGRVELSKENKLEFTGWACQFGKQGSLNVDLYAGRKDKDTLLGFTSADNSSHDVATIDCGGANKNVFKFNIPPKDARKYHGKSLLAYAGSVPLKNSGRYLINCPGNTCELQDSLRSLKVTYSNGKKSVTRTFGPESYIHCAEMAFGLPASDAPGYCSSDLKKTIANKNEGFDFVCPIDDKCSYYVEQSNEMAIRYGTRDAHVVKSFNYGDKAICSNQTFGKDPIVGVVKSCFTESGRSIASEGESFIVSE